MAADDILRSAPRVILMPCSVLFPDGCINKATVAVDFFLFLLCVLNKSEPALR